MFFLFFFFFVVVVDDDDVPLGGVSSSFFFFFFLSFSFFLFSFFFPLSFSPAVCISDVINRVGVCVCLSLSCHRQKKQVSILQQIKTRKGLSQFVGHAVYIFQSFESKENKSARVCLVLKIDRLVQPIGQIRWLMTRFK